MDPIIIERHHVKAAATWGSAGERYDEISRQLTSGIEHAIQRLRLQGRERVLDLACGTGWVSRSLADRHPRLDVHGIDLGAELVEAAKARAFERDLQIRYRIGDAEKLPFEEGAFDAVISTWGIMFSMRPEIASAELARVVKKGGRIVLTTWKPDSTVFEMFSVMKPYMTPVDPPPPSPFAWGREERVRELLGAHFDLAFEDGVAPFYAEDGESAWEHWVRNYGPTKMLAESLDLDRRAAFRKDMVAFHERFRTALGISKPRQYLLVAGTRR